MPTLVQIKSTRATADWKCPRSRYFSYDYMGRGLTVEGEVYEFFVGAVIHEAFATIATETKEGRAVDIDAIALKAGVEMIRFLLPNDTPTDEEFAYSQEQVCLVEGIIRGYYKHTWPRLLEQYPTIVAVEHVCTYTDDEKTFTRKPDLILADRDGELVYIEYKSTSAVSEEWIASWETHVQVHAACLAIEQTLGQACDRVIVQGLLKGTKSYGKQGSPFCYAYKKFGQPPFSEDQVEYEYKAGFKRTPVWELEGGLKSWVGGMPENVLANQFPQTPPIFIKKELIHRWLNQRMGREVEVRMALDMLEANPEGAGDILDYTYPQRFDQCQPGFRNARPCPFKIMCFGEVMNPTQAGFILREEPTNVEETLP